jgi:hypothetical protein
MSSTRPKKSSPENNAARSLSGDQSKKRRSNISTALKNVWEPVLKTEETVVLTAIVILLGPVKVVKTPRTIKV